MSSDIVQQKQYTQSDYMRLLNNIFKKEVLESDKENVLNLIEKNFEKQPLLINTLIEYYIVYDVNSPNNASINSSSKTVIDLICRVPDFNKLFDEINKVMNKFPMLPQPQQNVLSTLNTNYFERVTNLIVWLVDRKKQDRYKLVSHQFLNNIIKTVLKLGNSMTELITVHSSILIVFLINSAPSQMFSLYSEALFQIFILYFKYLCNLEQNRSYSSVLTLCSVKWSVRLYFYVCYGFYSNHFLQYVKKKEPQMLAKDFFTNMFVYLRLHPNLFNESKMLKDKLDQDKINTKQSNDESFEWRQYCLDPLYTNFNQVVQNIKNTESLAINNTDVQLMNSLFDYSSFFINTFRSKNNEHKKNNLVSPPSVPTTPTQVLQNQKPVFQFPPSDQNSSSPNDLVQPINIPAIIINDTSQIIKSTINENESNLLYETKINKNEAYDLINAIHTNLKSTHASSSPVEITQSPNATISKLKDENNHLILQLTYERSLRNKYEEESNRMHVFKIERDQLHGEKIFIEKYLKDLVEQYKNEVENSLTVQSNIEINAYKDELEEKKSIIEKMQKKLEDSEIELRNSEKNCEYLTNENKNLEKALAESNQLLEKEQNSKTKYEIDYQYMNSLRYTTDILRRKLLLMSKAQNEMKLQFKQQIQSFYNQDLNDLSVSYNNNLMNNTSDQLEMENIINSIKASENNLQQRLNVKALPLNAQIYQFQQTTIKNLETQIENMKNSYNKLIIDYNKNEVELDDCKRKLVVKEVKLDELEETNSIEINAELMKNQFRVYSSLMNVNKKLEEQILKLKANLQEEKTINQRLERRQDDQLKEFEEKLKNFRDQIH